MGQPERVGVYGGSFDPVHYGHLALAEEVRHALGLSRVYFVPAARQPLKAQAQQASGEQRLAMLELACVDQSAFVPLDVELRRPPPSYTIDTLEQLRDQLAPTVELWFLLGADALQDLPRWHRPLDLLAIARLAVVERPGHQLDLAALEQTLPGVVARCEQIEGPRLDIASSELRQRFVAGRPVRYQLPEAVRKYIDANGLYRSGEHERPGQ